MSGSERQGIEEYLVQEASKFKKVMRQLIGSAVEHRKLQ